jgi:hypothetical protein
MKARLVPIVAAALVAASGAAQAQVGLVTGGGYTRHELVQLAAAPAGPAGEITGAAAVARYNELVQMTLDMTRSSLNVYRLCMEQRIALALTGKDTSGLCTAPTVPVIPPLGWREDTPQGATK